MGRKLQKIKTLLKNKAKIKNALLRIIYDEKKQQILKKYNKTELNTITPSEFFRHFDNYSLNEPVSLFTDFMNGSSQVIDYLIICHAAKALKIKNYFEIGTWVGISAFNVSVNSPPGTNIYTLDLPFDHPEVKEYNIPVHIFGYHSKSVPNINHLKGDSLKFDFSPYKGKIDMVFVDGSHSMHYVINNSRKALEMLKGDESVILWHDYILGGNLNTEVLCGILEGIPENEHCHLFYLQQSNMAIYCKSLNYTPRKTGMWEMPEYKYQINITLKKT